MPILSPMYQYNAKLIRVIDGDTLDAMIDLGFNTWVKKRVRLNRINAYEVRTRDAEKKKLGLLAKDRLVKLLASSNDKFLLISHGVGKYGRCLGEVILTDDFIRSEKYHGKNVNDCLVVEGYAKKYEG